MDEFGAEKFAGVNSCQQPWDAGNSFKEPMEMQECRLYIPLLPPQKKHTADLFLTPIPKWLCLRKAAPEILLHQMFDCNAQSCSVESGRMLVLIWPRVLFKKNTCVVFSCIGYCDFIIEIVL